MNNFNQSKHKAGTILIQGTDGKPHKARVMIRSFKTNPITGFGFERKYLYLTYRDGQTVRQVYMGKMR